MELREYSLKNEKAELVLKNANIVNVFSNEIIKGDIAIEKGIIVGIGSYEGVESHDLKGKFVVPGLIDPHIHIESTMVSPGEFARSVVPLGTTTVIADPHEIANVMGLKGIEYMLEATENIPLDVFFMLPSCVPVTEFEDSGARLEAEELEKYINHPRILGLGEMMDYPGVISGKKIVFEKLELAKKYNKIIDGHIPEVTKDELTTYILSGITTDHESTTVEEMLEKIRLGMYVMIREGSAARNLETLIKGVNHGNYQRCLFCTDDKHPQDILERGHLDNNIKLGIQGGLDPIICIKMATINVANCYNLKNKGAIAPGYQGDLVVVDNLKEFNILEVYKNGKLVGKDKKALFKVKKIDDSQVKNSVNIDGITVKDLEVKVKGELANVIGVLPRDLITEKLLRKVDVENNIFQFNKDMDILKLAVIERHSGKKRIGLALVENFGLKNGAIASTIAHDSHNIIVVGDNDQDIINSVNKIKEIGGGIVISSKNEVIESLNLPIAGLMSDRDVSYVSEKLEKMIEIAHERLKVNKDIEPFMTLAFLALPVIPHIKLTDKGLFDVDAFKFIEV